MRKRLSAMATADLLAELRNRRRLAPRLERRRSALLAQLKKIDYRIASLGGLANGHRKRPRNTMPLADSLATVLSASKPMKVSDAVDAVLKSGYKTSAANFRTIVNQTLINDKRFKKAERGLYLLKK